MKIPLEDNFNDIISKAQRGYQLTDAQLAQQAGVPPEAVTRAKEGHFDESVLRKLAIILKLKPDALIASAKKEWYPVRSGRSGWPGVFQHYLRGYDRKFLSRLGPGHKKRNVL